MTSDLEKLRVDALEQISTYLPELTATEIVITEDNRETNIQITVDNTLYELVFDKTTKTIKDL